ncbi:MAG: Ankyrin-2 [Bogoriella megaspora]|nr:MAG: Ankyrin-2 [Bogoriella megaspora]
MGFIDLPNELLLQIIQNLGDRDPIYAIARVNRRLYVLAREPLLRFNVRHEGSSALRWAVQVGRVNVVRDLLRLGAVVDTRAGENPKNLTPLHVAAKHGHVQIIDILLEHGARYRARAIHGQRPIFGALVSGHETVAAYLFAQGSTRDRKAIISTTPVGFNALHVACHYERMSFIQEYIDVREDVDARTANRSTALHIVVEKHLQGQRVLDRHSEAAYARCSNIVKMLRMLLQAGAHPNSIRGDGVAPLYIVLSKHLHGQNLVVQGFPVEDAKCDNVLSTVKLLLEFGADPNIVGPPVGFRPSRSAGEVGSEHPDAAIRSLFRKYKSSAGRKPFRV